MRSRLSGIGFPGKRCAVVFCRLVRSSVWNPSVFLMTYVVRGRFKSRRRAFGLVRPMWTFRLKGRASGYRVPYLIMYSLAMRRWCRERRLGEFVRCGSGFVVDDIECSVVIDAAGKLSRFTRRQAVDEFGIQYVENGGLGSVLNFQFSEDGYGGGVSIEGGRSNFCFLVKKDALKGYLMTGDCLVTGPLAYDRLPGRFIAIGDAGGMVDPFCGEGMRHALETGILAARVVAAGLRRRAAYQEMKWEYESQWERRWAVGSARVRDGSAGSSGGPAVESGIARQSGVASEWMLENLGLALRKCGLCSK